MCIIRYGDLECLRINQSLTTTVNSHHMKIQKWFEWQLSMKIESLIHSKKLLPLNCVREILLACKIFYCFFLSSKFIRFFYGDYFSQVDQGETIVLLSVKYAVVLTVALIFQPWDLWFRICKPMLKYRRLFN